MEKSCIRPRGVDILSLYAHYVVLFDINLTTFLCFDVLGRLRRFEFSIGGLGLLSAFDERMVENA